MKTIFKIFISLLFFISCNDVKYVDVDISMQKINGEWIRGVYQLPEDYEMFIHNERGGYKLVYESGWTNQQRIIKNAVIDFKINNKK